MGVWAAFWVVSRAEGARLLQASRHTATTALESRRSDSAMAQQNSRGVRTIDTIKHRPIVMRRGLPTPLRQALATGQPPGLAQGLFVMPFETQQVTLLPIKGDRCFKTL